MKFVERFGRLYLEDITANDIYYTNLKGEKKGNGMFSPQHNYGIFITEPALIAAFRESNIEVKDIPDMENPEMTRYYVNFRAYPNANPKIMIKNSSTDQYVQRDTENWGDADTKRVKTVNMRFHIWSTGQYVIPVIDELWIEIDELASGPVEDDYYRKKLGLTT